MARHRTWTELQEVYLRAYFANTDNDTLAQALGKTTIAVRSRANILGLHKSEAHKRAVSYKQTPSAWSAAEDDFLRAHYPEMKTADVAAAMGRSKASIAQRANVLGLRKSDAYKAALSTVFKPGHAAWNKGQKGLYCGGKATQFKPGNTPHTHRPVGTVSVREGHGGKTGLRYAWIKIAEPNRWQEYHRYQWEQVNGPIPNGHILKCRTADTLNCAPENWELITRAEHASRKRWPHWQHIPEPIKECIRLRWQIIKHKREQHK